MKLISIRTFRPILDANFCLQFTLILTFEEEKTKSTTAAGAYSTVQASLKERLNGYIYGKGKTCYLNNLG
jgi:hypothetical protein